MSATKEKKYCTISVSLYLDMKKEISDLQSRLSKEIDRRMARDEKIRELEAQNEKLTKIIDAIM